MFSGSKGEDPIFLRIFERVGKALNWNEEINMDELPNYLSDTAEEFHYMYVDCALPEAQIPVLQCLMIWGTVRVEVIQGTHGQSSKHSKTCSV